MEFEGIPYEVVRRRVKYARVEFKPSGLRVVVPRGVKPMDLLTDNRDSILKKFQTYQGQIETSNKTPLDPRSVHQFEAIVNHYCGLYSQKLKVKAKQIKYRKMKRRWGSCRNDGMITINRFLQFVPETLVAYIVYHELAHLLERGHNRKFKAIIAAEFPDYRQLDKELSLYGLKLLID